MENGVKMEEEMEWKEGETYVIYIHVTSSVKYACAYISIAECLSTRFMITDYAR